MARVGIITKPNHSIPSQIFAALSLLGVYGCFPKAAESDIALILRKQPDLEKIPAIDLENRKQEWRDSTKKRSIALRNKTYKSLIWVLSAALLAKIVFMPSIALKDLAQQSTYAAGSILAFAWATLGRLGWKDGSIKGETIFEELDHTIFWVLYWIGTFLGVAALASS